MLEAGVKRDWCWSCWPIAMPWCFGREGQWAHKAPTSLTLFPRTNDHTMRRLQHPLSGVTRVGPARHGLLIRLPERRWRTVAGYSSWWIKLDNDPLRRGYRRPPWPQWRSDDNMASLPRVEGNPCSGLEICFLITSHTPESATFGYDSVPLFGKSVANIGLFAEQLLEELMTRRLGQVEKRLRYSFCHSLRRDRG